jgi:hypothetical protein
MIYDRKVCFNLQRTLTTVNHPLARIVIYDCNIVQVVAATIVNYDCNMFIEQTAGHSLGADKVNLKASLN